VGTIWHQGLRDELPAVYSKSGGGFWSHGLCGLGALVVVFWLVVAA